MKNSSKVLLAFGIGAVAGGVAGYYLNSDEGRVARRKASKRAKKQAKMANKKMNELANQAKTVTNNIVPSQIVGRHSVAAHYFFSPSFFTS